MFTDQESPSNPHSSQKDNWWDVCSLDMPSGDPAHVHMSLGAKTVST